MLYGYFLMYSLLNLFGYLTLNTYYYYYYYITQITNFINNIIPNKYTFKLCITCNILGGCMAASTLCILCVVSRHTTKILNDI